MITQLVIVGRQAADSLGGRWHSFINVLEAHPAMQSARATALQNDIPPPCKKRLVTQERASGVSTNSNLEATETFQLVTKTVQVETMGNPINKQGPSEGGRTADIHVENAAHLQPTEPQEVGLPIQPGPEDQGQQNGEAAEGGEQDSEEEIVQVPEAALEGGLCLPGRS